MHTLRGQSLAGLLSLSVLSCVALDGHLTTPGPPPPTTIWGYWSPTLGLFVKEVPGSWGGAQAPCALPFISENASSSNHWPKIESQTQQTLSLPSHRPFRDYTRQDGSFNRIGQGPQAHSAVGLLGHMPTLGLA